MRLGVLFFASLFVGPPTLFERPPPPGLARVVLLALLSGALARLWWRGAWDERLLWVAAACGVLLSIPVIFPDGAWRVLAPTWPFVAGLLSCGLAAPAERDALRGVPSAGLQDAFAGVLLGLFVVGVLLAPAAIPRLGPRTPPPGSLTLRPLILPNWPPFPAVAVLDDSDRTASRAPTVHFRDFPNLLKRSGMEDRRSLLQPVPPAHPFVLGLAYDVSGQGCRHFIGPLAMLQHPRARYLEVRVEPWRSSPSFDRVVGVRPVGEDGP